MTTPEEHRTLREGLGAYALGDLPADAASSLRAHLDGCAACRAELAEIAPLAQDLATVDPDALSDLPVPPADLGARIRRSISEERAWHEATVGHDRRRRMLRRVASVAAAGALLAGALGAGTTFGRATAPEPAAAPAHLVEEVTLAAAVGVRADRATIIAHTWGVEAQFAGRGFVDGEVYRAEFRTSDGALSPAGEFVGIGDGELRCNMQSALLREDAVAFVVRDQRGRQVLTADL